MNDETPSGHIGANDRRGFAGASPVESSPLQARASFLKNRSWLSVTNINRGLCERSGSQHGQNPESFEAVEKEWEEFRSKDATLLETLDFLKSCHRKAPFFFLNGNTFGETGRFITDAIFEELPYSKKKVLTSAVAHYIAGVQDRETMIQMVESLTVSNSFKVGDMVQTLKGSIRGKVTEILPDGKIKWNDGIGELITGADSLKPYSPPLFKNTPGKDSPGKGIGL